MHHHHQIEDVAIGVAIGSMLTRQQPPVQQPQAKPDWSAILVAYIACCFFCPPLLLIAVVAAPLIMVVGAIKGVFNRSAPKPKAAVEPKAAAPRPAVSWAIRKGRSVIIAADAAKGEAPC